MPAGTAAPDVAQASDVDLAHAQRAIVPVIGNVDRRRAGACIGSRGNGFHIATPIGLERLRQQLFGATRIDHVVVAPLHDCDRRAGGRTRSQGAERIEPESAAQDIARVLHAELAEQRRRRHRHRGGEAQWMMKREQCRESAAGRQTDNNARGLDRA